VTPPAGAYLIVLASQPKQGGYAIGKLPAVSYTVRRIDYRDAPSCRGTGTGHGTVSYSPGGAHGGGMPTALGDPDNLTVGTFTTTIG
jgi:hypothetical protein